MTDPENKHNILGLVLISITNKIFFQMFRNSRNTNLEMDFKNKKKMAKTKG